MSSFDVNWYVSLLTKKLHQQPHGGSGLPMDSYTDGDEEASGDSAPSQRQRLLQGTSLLEQGNERLAASTRLALETEDIGANILQDLRGQREQIEHSRDTVCARLADPASRRQHPYRSLVSHFATHDSPVGIRYVLTQCSAAKDCHRRDHCRARAPHPTDSLFEALLDCR